MVKLRSVKKNGENGDRVITNSDYEVLRLIDFSYHYLRRIDDQVDPHKRFDKNDTEDRYGEDIVRVYETGKRLFGGK